MRAKEGSATRSFGWSSRKEVGPSKSVRLFPNRVRCPQSSKCRSVSIDSKVHLIIQSSGIDEKCGDFPEQSWRTRQGRGTEGQTVSVTA